MARSRFGMTWGLAASLGVCMGLATLPAPVLGQSRERDVTITGPRGNTLQRHVETQVGPGRIQRQFSIQRPNGSSLSRSAQLARPPVVAPQANRGGGFVPAPGFGRGPTILERNVLVQPRRGISGAEAFGLGALGGVVGGAGTLLLNKALTPPPPPVVAAPVIVQPVPPPVIVQPVPPPVVVASPPVQYVQVPQATVVVDPVAQAMGRLNSTHANSRKEGALVLGRLGDPRAVPALIERLKVDTNKEVRIAAVNALADIGDPRGAIALDRVRVYDKKQDVRDAAAVALARMPREAPVPAAATTGEFIQPSAPAAAPRSPELRPIPDEAVPPPPVPLVGTRRN